MIMKIASILMVALTLACGGKQSTTQEPGPGSGSAEPVGVVRDTRTEIERRRDAACEALAPRMTSCAVEDAKAQHAAGKVSAEQLAKDTAPEVQSKNTDEFLKACKVPMRTRKVRVLEVCHAEEKECAPLLSCLEHLSDDSPEK